MIWLVIIAFFVGATIGALGMALAAAAAAGDRQRCVPPEWEGTDE